MIFAEMGKDSAWKTYIYNMNIIEGSKKHFLALTISILRMGQSDYGIFLLNFDIYIYIYIYIHIYIYIYIYTSPLYLAMAPPQS